MTTVIGSINQIAYLEMRELLILCRLGKNFLIMINRAIEFC